MNNKPSAPCVRDVGEQGLLKRLQQFCPPEIIGDDAAVIAIQPGHSLVATTDVLVDGVHFGAGITTSQTVYTTSPEDVGWRAAAVNLSDLAAMGALPLGLTVGLGVPGEVPVAWLEKLYQGLSECLQQYGTAVVGGDVCQSPVITLAIAAFGQVVPGQVIQRSAAQPGDAILVTGVHGASRAGLELLLNPDWGGDLTQPERQHFIQAHQRPRPRLDVPPLLWRLGCERTAGMDSSDGLADAVLQICRASRVGARIERAQVPIPSPLARIASPDQALEWALYGGEDFELVLTLPPAIATSLVQQLSDGAAVVGSIIEGPEAQVVDATGQQPVLTLSQRQGFQHF